MQPVTFMARLIGPLFVVLGIGVLLNQKLYTDMIGQAILVPVLIYLSGMLALAAGIAMLNGYHRWTPDWRIIITILGWVMVIAGIVRVVLPGLAATMAISIYSGPAAMAVAGAIVLALGGYLSFEGYRAASK